MRGYYAHDLRRGRARVGTNEGNARERERTRVERLDSIIERSIQDGSCEGIVAVQQRDCVSEEDFNFVTG